MPDRETTPESSRDDHQLVLHNPDAARDDSEESGPQAEQAVTDANRVEDAETGQNEDVVAEDAVTEDPAAEDAETQQDENHDVGTRDEEEDELDDDALTDAEPSDTAEPSEVSDEESKRSLLEELDDRQNAVLDQLDELNKRIEALIQDWTNRNRDETADETPEDGESPETVPASQPKAA